MEKNKNQTKMVALYELKNPLEKLNQSYRRLIFLLLIYL